MLRSIIHQRVPFSIASFPEWIVWVGLIPLGSGLGAFIGSGLDVSKTPVPDGFGTDWTKLLGFLGGMLGLGALIGVLAFS